MKKRYVIVIETKPRKFTEKDFEPELDTEFEDNDFELTKQVDNSLHLAFNEWLETQLTDNEDLENDVIKESGMEDELPFNDFCEFGSVKITFYEDEKFQNENVSETEESK